MNKADFLKVTLDPPVCGLAEYLQMKLLRSLHSEQDLDRVKDNFKIYLCELYHNYSAFQMVTDMRFTLDSMRPGPSTNLVTFAYNFELSPAVSQYPQDFQHF